MGDQFADAQGRSVVVQIEGKDPGRASCPQPETLPPPVVTPTTPPKPGDGAPHTGGEGGDVAVGLVVGRGTARRSRPRGGRGAAASPGGHPSVTSARAGGPPKGRPAHPSVTLTRAGRAQGPPRAARVKPTVEPCACQKRPQVAARLVERPRSRARSGSCARPPRCSVSWA